MFGVWGLQGLGPKNTTLSSMAKTRVTALVGIPGALNVKICIAASVYWDVVSTPGNSFALGP